MYYEIQHTSKILVIEKTTSIQALLRTQFSGHCICVDSIPIVSASAERVKAREYDVLIWDVSTSVSQKTLCQAQQSKSDGVMRKPLRTLLHVSLVITGCLQPVLAEFSFTPESKSLEDAKKETKLIFYTTMEFPQNGELIRLFAEKYPRWNIEIYPLETETLVKKIQDEARGRAFTWDVLLGGGGSL
jgi:hypothetical protein